LGAVFCSHRPFPPAVIPSLLSSIPLLEQSTVSRPIAGLLDDWISLATRFYVHQRASTYNYILHCQSYNDVFGRVYTASKEIEGSSHSIHPRGSFSRSLKFEFDGARSGHCCQHLALLQGPPPNRSWALIRLSKLLQCFDRFAQTNLSSPPGGQMETSSRPRNLEFSGTQPCTASHNFLIRT